MTIILLSLPPVFIILMYVYFRDKYEKEPISLLLKALLTGALVVIPVLLTDYLFNFLKPAEGSLSEDFYSSFFEAGTIEESFKFIGLYFLIWRNPNFNEKFDGIVYAVFVSLGFAAVENLMYVAEGGLNVALLRAVTAVPAHALFGVQMGYYFGIAHMYPELRKSYLRKALFIPIILHGVYDFMILSKVGFLLLLFIPYLVWLYFAGFREMRVVSEASEFRPLNEDEQNL